MHSTKAIQATHTTKKIQCENVLFNVCVFELDDFEHNVEHTRLYHQITTHIQAEEEAVDREYDRRNFSFLSGRT